VKRILAVIVLLLICPYSRPACADAPLPVAIVPDADRIHITPAFQIPVNDKPPLDCSTKTRGTMALDTRTQLCICLGDGWKLVNTAAPCVWAPAK